jgi:hypothetical protein
VNWPEPHVPAYSPRRRLAIVITGAVAGWAIVIAAIVAA